MFPGRGRHVNLLIGHEPVPSKHSSMFTTAAAYRTCKIVWRDFGRCECFSLSVRLYHERQQAAGSEGCFGKPPLLLLLLVLPGKFLILLLLLASDSPSAPDVGETITQALESGFNSIG